MGRIPIPGKMSVGVKTSIFKRKLNKKIKKKFKIRNENILTPTKFNIYKKRTGRINGYLAETAQSSNRKKEILTSKEKPKKRKIIMVYTPGKGKTPKKKLVSPIKVHLRSEARSEIRKRQRAEREVRRRQEEKKKQ